MKKINVLIVFILAGLVGFVSSCKKDLLDLAAPVVTFVEIPDGAVVAGNDVIIACSVYAPGELDEIVIFKDDASYGDPIKKFASDTLHNFNFTIDGADVTETFTVEVQATDKNGKIGKKSTTITVLVSGPVDKSTTITLYTAPGDLSGTQERFTSLTPDFSTYSWTGATGNEADIDMVYYNGNYSKAKGTSYPHFASPNFSTAHETFNIHNDQIISGAKQTYFKVVTGSEATAISAAWDTMNDDLLIQSITGISSDFVTWDDSGAPGTIIAFLLADGRKGLIKAGNAVDGNANTEYYDAAFDYITFDVIVQQNAPAK